MRWRCGKLSPWSGTRRPVVDGNPNTFIHDEPCDRLRWHVGDCASWLRLPDGWGDGIPREVRREWNDQWDMPVGGSIRKVGRRIEPLKYWPELLVLGIVGWCYWILFSLE